MKFEPAFVPPKSADATRTRLIDTAERLFGQYGISAVSLRTVSAEAGQRNEKAVQYHFKTKAGLIDAIFDVRVPWLEARRRELLESALDDNKSDIRTLLEILTRPLAELVDENGCAVYVQFLMQFSIFKSEHRIVEMSSPNSRSTNRAQMLEIFRRLGAQLPHVPPSILAARLEVMVFSFLSVIVERQNALNTGQLVWPLELSITHVLDMGAAAIAAPVSQDLLRAAPDLYRRAYPWYEVD